MISLFRNATPWLLASLIGIAVYSGMLAQQYATERDAAQARTKRADERATHLAAVMDWQREQLETLHAALDVRDDELANARQDIEHRRAEVQALERDDSATGEWASGFVPAAVDEWLRRIDDTSARSESDSGGAEGSSIPAEPAASAGTRGEPQP